MDSFIKAIPELGAAPIDRDIYMCVVSA